MNELFRRKGKTLTAVMTIAVMLSAIAGISETAQTSADTSKVGDYAISQPLAREGYFAAKLVEALSLGVSKDEIEAETALGELGIAPRNGWIADYPVTPDIIDEIQKGIVNAVNAKKLKVDKDEAMSKYQKVISDLALNIKPTQQENKRTAQKSAVFSYDNKTVINNYYVTEGPPVITYYPPPPDFLYLYAWVDYPFWFYDFWFPGYYILNDFHKVLVVNGETVFITNHFRAFASHNVLHIDPIARFNGRTFAGIGAPTQGGRFLRAGRPESRVNIFNKHSSPCHLGNRGRF